MSLLGSKKEHRGAGNILRRGGPLRKGHQVPVNAKDGEICPSPFQVLLFLLNAIFLSHMSKNLFYVFNFLFIGVQFV